MIPNQTELLDCTLRDGAYLIDKQFGDTTIKGIISGLVKTKIDYIEIGFFQNDGFGEGKTVFRNSADARRFIPDEKNGCRFTVLADYSRFSVSNLDLCTNDSIDAVRECFFKNERFEAIEACKVIKEKGYQLFVQPVDILGYSDKELIEFLELINQIEPYCFSIVDTFGSMYQEDLHRIFELINHNLIPACKIGFHSHNNMQLSNALAQEFIRMTLGKREIVVDGTINGMGRGAGNTPTELVAQYLVSKLGYGYNMDALLDVIDDYMDNIRSRCNWGYTTQYFVAGSYGAHVNNIAYLSNKNSIRSKDIRYILNKIGAAERKRYNYDLLENTYLELLKSNIDDADIVETLKDDFKNKEVLVLVPGSSVSIMKSFIQDYVKRQHPVIISVNFVHDTIDSDYVFVSNLRRYQYWMNNERFKETKKIFSSNVISKEQESATIVSFVNLVKCGWEHLDNSTLMLLRLLDKLGLQKITLAGLDGFEYTNGEKNNYVSGQMELSSVNENPIDLNNEIAEMLRDFAAAKHTTVEFLTPSRFEKCFKK